MAGEVVAMETRLAVAIARRVDGHVSVTDLSTELGISRQTFYVYERRYAEQGLPGLVPRSRAAHRHPNQVPLEVEDRLVDKREELVSRGLDGGARSVWAWMTRAGLDPPHPRTIHRIFVRRGVVVPQPQKRPRRSCRRFQAAAPNGCWQIDGMDWQLVDGTSVTVIRVIDDHSRKVFRTRVAPSESDEAAWACVQDAIATHGAPAMLLSDNSLAFNGSRRKVVVAMQKRLADLGIAQVAASADHPGTCGKVEREHQTMQRWLTAHPPATSMRQLQRLIDAYDDIYNTQRPHQALGGLSTPDERYAATTKAAAADHPLTLEPEHLAEVKVSSRGAVSAGSRTDVQIGRQWEGCIVAVARHGNHVAVFHHRQLIHTTTIDPTRRYQPSGRPRTGRRLPRTAAPGPG
jgi:transposase InsO family protein